LFNIGPMGSMKGDCLQECCYSLNVGLMCRKGMVSEQDRSAGFLVKWRQALWLAKNCPIRGNACNGVFRQITFQEPDRQRGALAKIGATIAWCKTPLATGFPCHHLIPGWYWQILSWCSGVGRTRRLAA